MNQKSNTRLLAITLTNFLFCLTALVWLFAPERNAAAQEPPAAFLGPIYYGSNPVTAVFDHQLPYLSLGIPDPFECTRHNNGTPCNPDPPNGFGYDTHDGIDYDLNYEIVLAAAGDAVSEAGWSNPTDHTSGLGLFARVVHGNNYSTEYGHLSVLQVQTGGQIEVDPDNRQGLIGISGNTGNSTGPHLHFGLLNPNGIRVNPYGWIGAPGTDPWESDPDGAPSYNVWVDEPSITTAQFDDGDEINDPGVNNARMIIDDGSADFVAAEPSPPCIWHGTSGNNSAYNRFYYRTLADVPGGCTATWHIHPDAFTPPGEYDVFAHIPNDTAASLGVEYTIQHNGETNTAVVVQAAYRNNPEHNAWAYLGRYDFAMDNDEFVQLNSQTVIANPNTYVLADAIKLSPAFEAPLPQETIYVSFAQSGTAGNVIYQNEDILAFNTNTGQWSMVFDGSDVGLSNWNLDAAEFEDGNIYFSIDNNFGSYINSDVIRFTPTSLGNTTSGTMSIGLSGNPYLTKPGEDVDAISFMANGNYLLSTLDQFDVPNVTLHEDEDVFSASPSPTPAYSNFLDGSAIGLAATPEDVDAFWLDTNFDMRYLSTEGNFTVTGSSGDGADIIRCQPGIISVCTFVPGLFWNGSAHGIGGLTGNSAQVDAILGPHTGDCSLFKNGGFESQLLCWEALVGPNPTHGLWRPSTVEPHSGQFSAERLLDIFSGETRAGTLTSSPISVNDNHTYRFRFWAKGAPDEGVETHFVVYAVVYWYAGTTTSTYEFSKVLIQNQLEWSNFDSGFICPPSTEYDTARIQFEIYQYDGTGSIFIDDVTWESQTPPPSPCPGFGQD